MTNPLVRMGMIAAGYTLTLATSGVVVRTVLNLVKDVEDAERPERPSRNATLGTVIGKCENILAVSFVLMGEFTALAVIFTAKSILRAQDVPRDPKYYLGGTLVNFTYSVLMGLLLRIIITG